MLLPHYSPGRDVCSVHVALIQWQSLISVKETTNTLYLLKPKGYKNTASMQHLVSTAEFV